MFSSEKWTHFQSIINITTAIFKKIDVIPWLFPTLRSHHLPQVSTPFTYCQSAVQLAFAFTLSLWSTIHMHFYDLDEVTIFFLGELYTLPPSSPPSSPQPWAFYEQKWNKEFEFVSSYSLLHFPFLRKLCIWAIRNVAQTERRAILMMQFQVPVRKIFLDRGIFSDTLQLHHQALPLLP